MTRPFSAVMLLALAAPVAAIPPHDLSNFQGQWPCASAVRMGKPKTIADLQVLVASAERVRGVGAGHSWWAEQMCAAHDAHGVDILLTEMANKRIIVDEVARTAKIDAGIITHDALDYLAKYGSGWTLGAFPWFTFQTVAGAVATGTHGSSLSFGSLSNDAQLLALDVVLANGTLVQISKAAYPDLWPAFQVSVGRLGVLTAVTLKIVPNAPMRREKVNVRLATFLDAMMKVQDAYNRAGESAPEVQALDGTMYCWWFTRRKESTEALWHSSVQWVGQAPMPTTATHVPFTVAGALSDSQLAAAMAGGKEPAIMLQPLQRTSRGAPPTPNDFGIAVPRAFGDVTALGMGPLFTNGTFPARDAIIAESQFLYNTQTDGFQYDQYEQAIPLSVVGTCYAALAEKLYGPEQRWRGFRSPGLLRFVTGNGEGLLSPTQGGTRAYINIEDYLKYQTFNSVNADFQAIWAVLRSSTCRGRMHWGKTGWASDVHASGFHGTGEYGDGWCTFGCVVKRLDPTGKFRAITPVWNWDSCGPC